MLDLTLSMASEAPVSYVMGLPGGDVVDVDDDRGDGDDDDDDDHLMLTSSARLLKAAGLQGGGAADLEGFLSLSWILSQI